MLETARLMADAWKVMVGRLPDPHIEDADAVASCLGNVPLIFLNLSVIHQPSPTAADLRDQLRIAGERARQSAFPAGLVVREDWLPSDGMAVLQDVGLAPVLPMTHMETSVLLPPRRTPADLEIRRVTDDATARDLAQLNAHAYGMPVELFECIANTRLWHADSHGYVGYREGRPVSCSAAFPVAGTVLHRSGCHHAGRTRQRLCRDRDAPYGGAGSAGDGHGADHAARHRSGAAGVSGHGIRARPAVALPGASALGR